MLYYYKSFISNTCKHISHFKILLVFKTKLKQIFRFNLFNVFFFSQFGMKLHLLDLLVHFIYNFTTTFFNLALKSYSLVSELIELDFYVANVFKHNYFCQFYLNILISLMQLSCFLKQFESCYDTNKKNLEMKTRGNQERIYKTSKC